MTVVAQKQLRHVFSVTSGATPDSGNAEFWDGNILWATPEDVSSLDSYWLRDTRRKITRAGYESCGTTTAPPGSIVLTKRAPIGQVAVLAEEACSNQGCFLLIPYGETDVRFYYYWLYAKVDYLQVLGRGSTFMELSTDELKSLSVPHPSITRQRAIANYLDREVTRLDALVAAKERVLGLLSEKRRALITRSVTRGLDPRAPLRDSGIPWLGKIPAHWEVKRVKYIFRLVADPAPEGNAFELLSLYTDIGVRPRKELEARGNKATTTDSYWMVQRGDLIVNKLLAWMGAFGVSDYDGVTSPAYDILRPIADIEPYYYHHLFRCGICQLEIRRRSYGIMDMRLRLYFDRLGDMAVPVPPREEQTRILELVRTETSQLDRINQATERTIALLKERRAALIAAAVTGRINVVEADT